MTLLQGSRNNQSWNAGWGFPWRDSSASLPLAWNPKRIFPLLSPWIRWRSIPPRSSSFSPRWRRSLRDGACCTAAALTRLWSSVNSPPKIQSVIRPYAKPACKGAAPIWRRTGPFLCAVWGASCFGISERSAITLIFAGRLCSRRPSLRRTRPFFGMPPSFPTAATCSIIRLALSPASAASSRPGKGMRPWKPSRRYWTKTFFKCIFNPKCVRYLSAS